MEDRGAGTGFIPLSDVRPASSCLDLEGIRERLKGAPRGRSYWRSLEELAGTEEFQQYVEREFPLEAPREMLPLSRRELVRVMGATLALAGVAGCSYQPPEGIVPYIEQPETLVPGKPLFFATAVPRSGYATGVLGESHMGRPVKLEGNPEHPASLGATDIFTQASLLTLYDPDRSQSVRNLGTLTTWDVFLIEIMPSLEALRRNRGAGLRVLTGTVTSPTLAGQLERLLARYPGAKVVQHEPAGRENVREGARLAFGEEVHPVYHFDRADTILSLDANFLVDEPGSVRHARDFIDGRRVRQGRTEMNRLYVVESTPTITGANADHRLPLRAGLIAGFAEAVAARLGVAAAARATAPEGVSQEWLTALARDLHGHRGSSLVIAGPNQPPIVHALAHAMNDALGNTGQTVTYTDPVEVHFGPRESTLRELVDDISGGLVEMFVILGSNPVYTAPADLGFAEALQRVPQRIHLGLYDDETGVLCQWHIPESHYLEAWSDARAYDGTVTILQPLIMPLYASRSAHELLAVLLGEGDRPGYDIVREHWQRQDPRFRVVAQAVRPAQSAGASPLTRPATGAAQQPVASPEFDRFWHDALLSGVGPGRPARSKSVALKADFAAGAEQAAPAGVATVGGLELTFRPDPTIWDGSAANNGWLQELPKPFTSLTWDNAAMISPATAQARGLQNGDMVELSFRGHEQRAAVWVLPGQPEDSVTLSLGYGRPRAGRVGRNLGFNAYALRTTDATWFGSGLEIRKLGGHYKLASAQNHHLIQTGPTSAGVAQRIEELARVGTIQQFLQNPTRPAFMHREAEEEEPLPSLYPQMWPSDNRLMGGTESAEPPPPPSPAPPGTPGEPGERRGAEQAVGQYEGAGYSNRPAPQWAMVIDLNACIGCGACTLACQAENNIATVGKDQVLRHREMHWIRVDNYFSGGVENPQTVFQPVPCMHCEKAPCEPVCPVMATSHSAEGINEQTYNRCVGTRYCQNNCPWKVRRFNYLQYSDQKTPAIQLLRNPDVTVRSRGVMEKCTYCIQRINYARIEAEKEERPIRDGDVVTACQQVCPTRAIIFGNLNDPESEVRKVKAEPLNYATLTELNARPRTTYLARLRNPNPEITREG